MGKASKLTAPEPTDHEIKMAQEMGYTVAEFRLLESLSKAEAENDRKDEKIRKLENRIETLLSQQADHATRKQQPPVTPRPCSEIRMFTRLADNTWLPKWTPIPAWLTIGFCTLWHGSWRSGKSLLVLSAAVALACNAGEHVIGRKVLGMPDRQNDKPTFQQIDYRILLVSLEDDFDMLHGRLTGIFERFNLSLPPEFAYLIRSDFDAGTDKLGTIEDAIRQHKPHVVLIDNLRMLSPEAERESDVAIKLVSGLNEIAGRMDCAIALVHHDRKMPGHNNGQPSRGSEMASGTGALMSTARGSLQVWQDDGIVYVGDGAATHAKAQGVTMFRIEEQTLKESGWSVPVLIPYDKPDPLKGIAKDQIRTICDALAKAEPAHRNTAKNAIGWAGVIVAHELDIDVGGPQPKQRTNAQATGRKRVGDVLDSLVKDGYLETERFQHKTGSRNRREGTAYKVTQHCMQDNLLNEDD